MATITKRQARTIEPPQEEAQLPALTDLFGDQEPEPDDVAFSNMLADIGADDDAGRVNVYKLAGGEFRRQVFLFDCLPSEFSMSMLQDPAYHEDGFHSFRVVARGKGGAGIKAAKTLEALPRKGAVVPGNAAPAVDASAIVAPIMQAIAAQNEQTNKLISALAGAQQPQKTTADILNEMLLMKQIIGSDQRQAAQPNPIELMRSVVDLSREIAQPEGGATNADVMVKLMEKFGGPILEAVAATPPMPVMRTPQTAPMPAPMSMPQHVPTPAPIAAPTVTPVVHAQTPPDPTPEPAPEEEDMSFKLKMALAFLAKQAADDADPGLYAALVLDQAGDQVKQYLDMPNWFELISQISPAVKPYQPWFTELRTEIYAQLTEPVAHDTSGAPEPMSAPDASAITDHGNTAGHS